LRTPRENGAHVHGGKIDLDGQPLQKVHGDVAPGLWWATSCAAIKVTGSPA
jgi:hypothetical protein